MKYKYKRKKKQTKVFKIKRIMIKIIEKIK